MRVSDRDYPEVASIAARGSPSPPLTRELRHTPREGESGAGPAWPIHQPHPSLPHDGPLTAAISNAVVGLLREFTGRGPTQARTTIGSDTIVVTLRDSLTKAERTLAERGQAVEVLAMRRAFQETMREDLIARRRDA